jgi:hypothetical protein
MRIFRNVRIEWDTRWRDRVFRSAFLLRCRWFNRHTDVLYSVGHNPGKECRDCKRHGTLTPEDIEELKQNWPTILRFPGGEDDEVAMESPPK